MNVYIFKNFEELFDFTWISAHLLLSFGFDVRYGHKTFLLRPTEQVRWRLTFVDVLMMNMKKYNAMAQFASKK